MLPSHDISPAAPVRIPAPIFGDALPRRLFRPSRDDVPVPLAVPPQLPLVLDIEYFQQGASPPTFPLPERKRAHSPSCKYERDYHAEYVAARDAADFGKVGRCGSMCVRTWRDGESQLRPVFCKLWSCAICGPRRAVWLRRQMNENGELWRSLVTLTMLEDALPEVEEHAFLMAAWDRLHTLLVREYGPFKYVWVEEEQKNGTPHLHLLMSIVPRWSWLKKKWKSVTKHSHIVGVERITGLKSLVKYVTKYLTKTAVAFRGRHQHRWGKSRGLTWSPFTRKRVEGSPLPELVHMSWYEVRKSRGDFKAWKFRELPVKKRVWEVQEHAMVAGAVLLEASLGLGDGCCIVRVYRQDGGRN